MEGKLENCIDAHDVKDMRRHPFTANGFLLY
jgi:hypothetical protein